MAASQNLLVFQEELLPCPPLPIPSTPAHPSMHQSWGMLSGFLYVSRQLMAPPSPSNPLHPPQSSVGIFGIPNLAPWPRCTRSSQMAAAACLVRRRVHQREGRKEGTMSSYSRHTQGWPVLCSQMLDTNELKLGGRAGGGRLMAAMFIY